MHWLLTALHRQQRLQWIVDRSVHFLAACPCRVAVGWARRTLRRRRLDSRQDWQMAAPPQPATGESCCCRTPCRGRAAVPTRRRGGARCRRHPRRSSCLTALAMAGGIPVFGTTNDERKRCCNRCSGVCSASHLVCATGWQDPVLTRDHACIVRCSAPGSPLCSGFLDGLTSPGLTPLEAQAAPLQHAAVAPCPRTASGLLQLPDQGDLHVEPCTHNTSHHNTCIHTLCKRFATACWLIRRQIETRVRLPFTHTGVVNAWQAPTSWTR